MYVISIVWCHTLFVLILLFFWPTLQWIALIKANTEFWIRKRLQTIEKFHWIPVLMLNKRQLKLNIMLQIFICFIGFCFDPVFQMIDTEVVAKYKRRGSEVMVFLHPMNGLNRRQQCFAIPVVRRQEVYDKNKAFIKIYDYYNEDISDVIAYEIPLECQIDSRFVAKKNDWKLLDNR